MQGISRPFVFATVSTALTDATDPMAAVRIVDAFNEGDVKAMEVTLR